MFLNSKFFRTISVLVVMFCITTLVFADTIRLKDGSIIKGKIISFDNGQFVILIGDGERQRKMRFFSDEIASIKFDSKTNPVSPNNSASTKLKSNEPTYTKTKQGDDTIITVGSAPKTSPSKTNDSSNIKKVNKPASNTQKSQPIRIKTKVLADNTSNGWTNSGWVVRKGQKIRILGNGRISLGNGRYASPKGIRTLPEDTRLMKSNPTGGLIAVIGDDNNDFIYVGADREFVATRDGALFLGINECVGCLNNNSGAYDVTIEIDLSITK